MSENQKDKSLDHLSEELKAKAEAARKKQAAIKAAKALENGDSQWSIVQEILQDIQAGYLVSNPNAKTPVTKLIDDLKKEIVKRYTDDSDVAQLLIEAIPSVRSIRVWLKKDGWDDAVWKKIRQDELFSPGKRSEVIKALHDRAVDKSDMAAKLYLTLSGDYQEKSDNEDASVETYREINKVLQGQRDSEE